MGNIPEAPAPAEETELRIVLKADGKVYVNGPMDDKITCFGLLKMAEMIIWRHKVVQGPETIIVPSFMPPKGFKEGN